MKAAQESKQSSQR